MKIKHFIPLSMAAAILTVVMPVSTALANTNANCVVGLETDAGSISPRYSYVQEINAGVYPNDTETVYDLVIRGADVVSVSGTAVLYKQTASGAYTKIDSEALNLKGGSIRYTGYLKSSGSGKYKIEFKGTAYAKNGSESLSIRNYGSY